MSPVGGKHERLEKIRRRAWEETDLLTVEEYVLNTGGWAAFDRVRDDFRLVLSALEAAEGWQHRMAESSSQMAAKLDAAEERAKDAYIEKEIEREHRLAAEADASRKAEALRSIAMVQAKLNEGHYEFDEQAHAEIANVVNRALGRA